jgi:ankyrin repeat protein
LGYQFRVVEILTVIVIFLMTGCSENQTNNKRELKEADQIKIQGEDDEKYRILLYEAVSEGAQEKVTNLLDKIKDIDIPNENGYTPLHWAVLMGQEEIVSILISRGARVNTTLPNGYTPLHNAVYLGNRNIVQLLIDHGADIYVTNQQSKGLLDLAVEWGKEEIIPLLKPLHRALENGDLNQVSDIVKKNPNSVNIKDEQGWYPLHLAVRTSHLEIVEFLIDKGADINARGPYGITPLRRALESDQQMIANSLLEKGARDQSDALLLQKKLKEREAIIWYLFYTGWVIKTKSYLLIFDYVTLDHFALSPNTPSCLSSGDINPQQIKDQNVVVFVPIIRDQNHINTLLSWKETIKDITYIIGEDKVKDPSALYIAPRRQKKIKNMEIITIGTTGFGEGFVVKADGLTIFYGGDHESSDQSWSLFTREIDYLQDKIKGFDMIFLQMIFQEELNSSKGVFYALEKLKPAVFFPNTAIASTPSYRQFIREVAVKKINSKIKSAENRGDLFFYNSNKNSLILIKQLDAHEIHDAVRQGDIGKVRALLHDNPKIVNAKDDRGRTPLFFASMRGHREIAQLLIANGADVNARDAYGDPPLYHATLAGHREIVENLVHHGAEINEIMEEGTPLSLAIYRGHIGVAELLIKMGADVNLKMKNGETVLHHAAEMGDRAIIEVLVKAGAEVNARTAYDVTPLHIAAVYGHREAVDGLIESGAEINVQSAFAGTPLHQSIAAGHEELVTLLLVKGAKNTARRFVVLKGDYFGMKRPGETPELFAPGIIKTIHRWIRTPTFSRDGKEVYWSAGAPHGIDERIWFMRQEDGRWQPPRIAPFSSKNQDANPHLSADGQKLFFCSNRPSEKNSESARDRDIWMVERKGSRWSEPENLGSPVNTEKPEPYVTVSQNGMLYFHANNYEGGRGAADIYRSRFVNDRYMKPENLGDSINSKYPDSCPCIAPDESYIVFQSVRPENVSPGFNLYVSFWNEDGTWTKAKNMGKEINMQEAGIPKISPDGKYLFFKREGEIYWVDTKIINELNPDDMN